jgi:hypothetical protein
MSSAPPTRRLFLTLPLALLLSPIARALGDEGTRRMTYQTEANILYGALRYRLTGAVEERVDRASGRYEVRVDGQGTSFANRGESRGILRGGRWAPLRSASWVKIAGREGRTEIVYDPERRTAHYRSRSETFFLGRFRVADDVVPVPAGIHVDDTMSAFLNHADGYWLPAANGALETRIVRRRRDPREGIDETSGTYRAEIVPVVLRLADDRASGRRTAYIDLTHFSAWAQADTPAQIVFGADGRPERITAKLMFGTSITVRFQPA